MASRMIGWVGDYQHAWLMEDLETIVNSGIDSGLQAADHQRQFIDYGTKATKGATDTDWLVSEAAGPANVRHSPCTQEEAGSSFPSYWLCVAYAMQPEKPMINEVVTAALAARDTPVMKCFPEESDQIKDKSVLARYDTWTNQGRTLNVLAEQKKKLRTLPEQYNQIQQANKEAGTPEGPMPQGMLQGTITKDLDLGVQV
ncbi:hypothetical protein Tco_0774810 [Tanacetum coccineum]|uniref:Uncharacterized protein n=1 Tax=Tanacetum coccineum TaxID=301880 RepID=A0ABQ4ZPI5_9ASTR